MTENVTIPTSEFVDKRGHKGSERRCIASGEVKDKSVLVRFALSPDGVVTPDIVGKLPGRGVWVSANRFALDKAIKTGAFNRGFKSKVTVPADLMDVVEHLLARKVLGLLTMALKSGHILMGFDQVKSAAKGDYIAWRIEASDGSSDGRSKIRVLTKAVSRELGQPIPKVVGCFSASELGQALGRETVVHAALKAGPLAKAFSGAVRRLSGFRVLIPQDWDDKAHESR